MSEGLPRSLGTKAVDALVLIQAEVIRINPWSLGVPSEGLADRKQTRNELAAKDWAKARGTWAIIPCFWACFSSSRRLFL